MLDSLPLPDHVRRHLKRYLQECEKAAFQKGKDSAQLDLIPLLQKLAVAPPALTNFAAIHGTRDATQLHLLSHDVQAPQSDALSDDDAHDLLKLAMVAVAESAQANEEDATPTLRKLAALASDPKAILELLNQDHLGWDIPLTDLLGWQPGLTKKGTVKAVGTDDHAGRTLYGEPAKRALAAHEQGSVQKSDAAINAVRSILDKGGKLDPSHFETLAHHLPHLSGAELKAVRTKLVEGMARRGRGTVQNRAQFIENIKGHVQKLIASVQEQATPPKEENSPASVESKPDKSGEQGGGFDFSHEDGYSGEYQTKKIGNSTLVYQVNKDGNIDLSSVRTPTKYRGNGEGRAAIQSLLNEADRSGKSVELLASPLDGKTKLGKLVDFYKSLGFEVSGRGNPAGDPKMIRKPKGGVSKEEHDKRMAELDPRDSGNAPQPEQAKSLSTDDRDLEAQAAAQEKLKRMEGWQADKPHSVAAEDAVNRANARVEASGAGEAELPPAKVAMPEKQAAPVKEKDTKIPDKPAEEVSQKPEFSHAGKQAETGKQPTPDTAGPTPDIAKPTPVVAKANSGNKPVVATRPLTPQKKAEAPRPKTEAELEREERAKIDAEQGKVKAAEKAKRVAEKAGADGPPDDFAPIPDDGEKATLADPKQPVLDGADPYKDDPFAGVLAENFSGDTPAERMKAAAGARESKRRNAARDAGMSLEEFDAEVKRQMAGGKAVPKVTPQPVKPGKPEQTAEQKAAMAKLLADDPDTKPKKGKAKAAPVAEQPKMPAKFDGPDAMEAVFDKVKGERFADKGRVPIYALRDEVRKQYGDEAASPAKFDELMHDLRRAGKLRLIPGDSIAGSRHPSWDAISEAPNEQQIKASIPSPSGQLTTAEWVGSGHDENGLPIPKPSHGPSRPEGSSAAKKPEPVVAKPTPKRSTKAGSGESLQAVVKNYGGIDPNSAEFKRFFSNPKEAMEYGIGMGVFKKGGLSIDQMATAMKSGGHIVPSDGEDEVQHLVDQLSKKAASAMHDASKKHETALDDYYKTLQVDSDLKGLKYEYNPDATLDDLERYTSDDPEVQKAVRTAAAAVSGEKAVGGSEEGGAGVPAQGNTDFNFGNNVKPSGGQPRTSLADTISIATRNMKPGERAMVKGYQVTRNSDGTYAVQTGKKTFHSGTAEDIAKHIEQGWEKQKWRQPGIDAALKRADEHPESSPFDPASKQRFEDEAKKLQAVPEGVEAVSLGDATKGRLGTVKTGPDGVKRVHFDDSPDEFASEAFEPLDVKHSYRVPDLSKPKPKTAPAGNLFG